MTDFDYRMVTLAREAAGLSQTSLAHQAGISQGFISKIENGFEEPSSDLMESIAAACSVPPEFFYQTEGLIGEGLVDLYHKKRMTLPAKPLKKANAMANVYRNEATRLLRTVDFENIADFPNLPVGELSPEERARAVRILWRMPPGPLPDLVQLIEAAGVPIYIVDLEHDKITALSIPSPVGLHVIVLNSRFSASGRRFALAHELGHLVSPPPTGWHTDIERDADSFAAESIDAATRHRERFGRSQVQHAWEFENEVASIICCSDTPRL